MVGHQAVGVDPTIQLGFPLPQILKVLLVVLVGCKHYLPIVSTLNHMMRSFRQHNSTASGHGRPPRKI